MTLLFGIMGFLGFALCFTIVICALLTVIDELPAIRRELQDMNALTRSQWDTDYKTGRIEKPVPVRRVG